MTTARTEIASLRGKVLGALQRIAPEMSPIALQPSLPLRHRVALDSMDWLKLLVALDDTLGIDIPETDYAKLVRLDDLLVYLAAKLSVPGGTSVR